MGCCSPNTTLTKVTCGQGTSCTGECSAIGASLCPSGTCTEDPEDCSPSLLLEQASREDSSGKQRAATSRPSWELRWCAPGCSTLQIHYNLSSLEVQRYCSETLPPGCRVRKHSACCFHPTCRSRKRRVCKWLNYFTGRFFKNCESPQICFAPQAAPVPNRGKSPTETGAAASRRSR